VSGERFKSEPGDIIEASILINPVNRAGYSGSMTGIYFYSSNIIS